VSKVHARTNANLKHLTLGYRHEALTNFFYGFRISQNPYEIGIHTVSIERHGYLMYSDSTKVLVILPL
jgi:hypothetical protein